MILLFDVDGTLVDGEHLDWECFREALAEVLEASIDHDFVSPEFEVTAPFLVRRLCSQIGRSFSADLEAAVLRSYLDRLALAHATSARPFGPFPGADLLLKTLSTRHPVRIGIISGDWREAVLLKARAAGLDLERFPLRTASHAPRRRDIITSLMAEMNASTDSTIYVGDGLWDLRTARELQLRFIGVGHRREHLRTHGATWILGDMHPTTWLGHLTLLPGF